MSRSTRLLLTVIVGIVGTFACLAFAALSNRPAVPRAPYDVTGEYGVIRVPGTAFIEAYDPATNSNIEQINVWDAAGTLSSGARVSCHLVDGNRVSVDNSTEAEGSTWFHLSTDDGCTGWVLSEFVRPTRQ